MEPMTGLPEPPDELRALDFAGFVGQPADEVRRAVEAAGGQLRVTRPGEAVHLDYRPARVTVVVDPDDRVTQVVGLG